MTATETRQPNVIAAFLARQWVPIVILLLAIVFIAQNRAELTVQLFWAKVSAPLWVVLAVLFAAGWLVGVVRTRSKAKRRG